MLADRVQSRLDALGISANKASVDAGLGRDYVRDILRGKVREPSADRLRRLAFVLRCRVLYLLGEDDEPGSPRDEDRPAVKSLPILFQIRSGFHVGDGSLSDPLDWPIPPLEWDASREWLEYVRNPEGGWPVSEGVLVHVSKHLLFFEALISRDRLWVVTRTVGGLIERSIRRSATTADGWRLVTDKGDSGLPLDRATFEGRDAQGVRIEGEVVAIYQYFGDRVDEYMRGEARI